MSKSKNRQAADRTQPGLAAVASAKSSTSPPRPTPKPAPGRVEPLPGPVAPMFSSIDWWVFVLASFIVMVGYLWTLAPNQTLEDSGELATASMYAGIPHPPGYPVWTVYTWFFTKILPFGNIAWRVGVASAFAGALSCGVIGMMVSRGSSMLIRGIAELKDIEGKLEGWLCLAAGLMGGLLMGFNGYYWSQAVIVEVYTLSVLSLVMVMIFLLRWLHAPHQYRYLYAALFVFGICFTNHQTLIVAAIGIEVLVAAAQPKLGRDLFLGNSLVYLTAVMLKSNGMLHMFDGNPPLFVIFNAVGIFSLVTCAWLVFQTRGIFTETLPVVIMGLLWVAGAGFYFYMPLAGMSTPPLNWGYPRTVEGFWHALQRGQYEKANPANIIDEPDRFAGQIWQYIIGCVDEFNLVFLALALIPFVVLAVNLRRDGAMKDMRWLALLNSGIVLLFLLAAALNIHAKTAGWDAKGLVHLVWYGIGMLMVVDLLVLIHVMIRFLQRRERAWMFGLGAMYLGLALLLLVLLNPAPDRQSKELNRVFFTSSHVMLAMWSGYGVALLGALLATNYQRFRRPVMWFAGASSAVALYSVAVVFSTSPSWREVDPTSGGFFYLITRWFDLTPFHDPLSRGTALFGLGLAVIPLVGLFVRRERAPMTLMLGLFLLLPAKSVLSHWWENEQRGHLFGYWFGHDMFTPPFKDVEGKALYPEMDRDTVLYGGTDPGRFNPTYMIYCESFIPARARQSEDPNFDRRDVYLITQNALADATYLNYIRAHYNRSAQKDPPFFTEFFKTDLVQPLDTLFLGLGDRIETARRGGSSLFKPADFKDLAGLLAKLKPGPQQDPLSRHLRDHVNPATRELIDKGAASPALASALARDFNDLLEAEFEARRKLQEPLDRLGQQIRVAHEREARREITTAQREAQVQDIQRQANELYAQYRGNPDWFYHPSNLNHLQLTPRLRRFIAQDLPTAARIRTGRQILEANYGALLAVSEGGVYPDLEINTATPEDSQQAFTEYIQDAQKRLEHDRRAPNEPKQIKQGEDVRIEGGRVQVSGQIAVMSINGLLTKVMFEKNPDHEFYVEESFPLDWMYPHLTPFGIIMKINRNPLAELSEDIIKRDTEFWSQYDQRTIGRWIKEDTSVKEICQFAERVYLRRDLREYKGSVAFVRDDNAQKAFSKLRSAIGGVYAWRINNAKSDGERRRMIAAADFTFRQAFAYCPYSPEATFRYINLLVPLGRIDDAILIATTCRKLDPENGAVANLVQQLITMKGGPSNAAQPPQGANTVTAVFNQVQQLVNQNRRPEAVALLDQLVASPTSDASVVMNVAQAYFQLQEMGRLESAMKRMVALLGNSPEANYDLAAVQAVMNKPDDSMSNLAKAIQLSAERLEKSPGSLDLLGKARTEARFQVLSARPDFQKLVTNYAPSVPNQAPAQAPPAEPQLPPGTPSFAIPPVPAVPAATNK